MILKLILFVAVVLAVFFGAHYLFYSAIVRLFATTNPALNAGLLGAVCFLSLSVIASVLMARFWENPLTNGYYFFAASWMGLFVNMWLGIGASWVAIGTIRLFGYTPNTQSIAIVFTALAVVFSAYGVYRAFHPKIKRIEVEIEGLPEGWKKRKIVQLSDVHLGRVHGVSFLEKLIEDVNALDPDLVFITGDLFDGMSGKLEPFAEPLSGLNTQKGIYFIVGNHENYIGVRRAIEVLEKTEVIVLRNEAVEVEGLQIIGVDYPGLGGAEAIRGLDEASKNSSRDKPTILLFHTPTNIRQSKEDEFRRHFSTYWLPDSSLAMNKEIGVDLQLSGHTHKGQLFPFGYLTRLIYKKYDYGFHKEGNFAIYTTSGVGSWGPPMRTGKASEIVLITLK